MKTVSARCLVLAAPALIQIAATEGAGAQTQLPEIRVTAPSPIVRRAPPRPAPRGEPAAPAPGPAVAEAPAPTQEIPQAGVLPIVTDQFATVTVVPNEELRRTPASTMGDLLFSKLGITGSSFAPGASSRPIIRGLDVKRDGIVENGLGGGGVSDLGEDHAVPIDPLSTNQVEVIRGPATLRYGSQSIGGVVSATNNRIPDALPCRDNAPLSAYGASPLITKAPAAPSYGPAPCVSFETRGAAMTVDNGLEGGALLDAGGGNFAIHADAYGRKADDFRIPT